MFVNFYIEDLWRKSSNNVSVYRVFKGCKPDTVKDVKLAKREVPQGKPPKVQKRLTLTEKVQVRSTEVSGFVFATRGTKKLKRFL